MEKEENLRQPPSKRTGARRIGNVYFAAFGSHPQPADPDVEQLAEIIEQIRDAVDSINTASHEIADGNAELTRHANASSKKIMEVIGVIDGVAFESNILALNAAVEASRAGDRGRSVSQVAVEIRNLVQKSAVATREIHALIRETVKKFEGSSKLVEEVGKTMDEIVRSVRQVTDIMCEITSHYPARLPHVARIGPPDGRASTRERPVVNEEA